jgi:assimilatory nitrate reductase catalytic subunit
MTEPATAETRTTCPYCGVGCGVLVGTAHGRIVAVRGDPEHPANFGRLCSKGAALHRTAAPHLDGVRATRPEWRATRDAARAPVAWDVVLDALADRFARCVAEHGPDAVAFYVSGQLLTEDYYVFNKLAKGLICTNNIDTNSRLCMSSAVAAYKQTLGADAPPCCYEDLDAADVVLIAGSNAAYAHPVLYRRLEAARARRPDMKVIVVDPRRTDTAREADLHLPILPGTDVALFNAMLHVMVWEDLVDREFVARATEGFDAVRELVREQTPSAAAQVCGVRAADIVSAARWFARAPATLSLYCQGLNQSSAGTAKNAALINLHLATAQIGKPGAGPFSLTGQPNAMGGREVGGLANLLPAHRDLADPAHRAEVAALWGVDAVPATPGKTAVEMFDALRAGTIRMVWIACTNPAQSLPDQHAVHEALTRAELVVLQEAYRDTECARYADALLPAATWGEKDGTVTNSERRISRVRAAVAPPGDARADWRIAVDFARRLEARLRPARPTLFPYATSEDVWNEHRATTIGRDLDIGGLSYARLQRDGPQQWPLPAGAGHGRARLYEDHVFATPSGRARFVATPYRPVAERVDARYPLALTTGRLRDQWHAMSRSGTVAHAYAHAPEPCVELNAADLLRHRLADGELVRLDSRRGSVHLIARASEAVRAGQAFVAMHWGARFLGGAASRGVNTLTIAALDPSSKQPELKHAAVRVAKAGLPWRLTAFAYPERRSAIALVDALGAHFARYPFASAVLAGRAPDGVLLRLAAAHAPDDAELAALDALLELDGDDVARYDDAPLRVGRRVAIADGRLRAVRLSGPPEKLAAEPWLKDCWERREPVAPIRRLLLLPSAAAPAGRAPRGPVVCNCWNVSRDEIVRCVAELAGTAAQRLQALQQRLRCGTSCGSCVPELRHLCADRNPDRDREPPRGRSATP